MTDAFPDIPAIALDWHRAGRGAALATVIETWGSAPRAAGSQLVVDRFGAMEGSVSGGCVEGAVVTEAMAAIADGLSRLLDYGVADEDAFAVGLGCGGRIRVLVDPVGGAMDEALLADLVAARAQRRPVALVVDLEGERRVLEGPDAHAERFAGDQSGIDPDGRFVGLHNPPLRLVVVGAVHIAQALVPMARIAGFDVAIVDPRDAFAAQVRFPGARLIHDWPDAALGALAPDARTAVVTLTHDAKIDDPALRAALESRAFYIGCLGSTRTHAKRLERLVGEGVSGLERLDAPVGLDIGARGPAEIAVSILAGIVAALRRPGATL
ncbi:XdhC family protein [Limimaricola cinnabarinus]|uniref:Carbon monoxide dehydrogenase F protein n=1 Tax=Limimaricola cinnabarinus LL-001 TaxID=1337093 RepID=U2YIA5_9RHOB|nr:XdhC/CoxI family protein [Limimaricola cinnabarinus]GAD54431.1 carbon monoxide dehydrogenase F protein [Limimaricola cinnabarinus LL-001]